MPKVERAPARLDSIPQLALFVRFAIFRGAGARGETAVRRKNKMPPPEGKRRMEWENGLAVSFATFPTRPVFLPLFLSCHFFATFPLLVFFASFCSLPVLVFFCHFSTSPVSPLPICAISFVLSFFCCRCAFKLRATRRYVNASILDRG